MEAPLDSQAYENDYHETKNETVCKQCVTKNCILLCFSLLEIFMRRGTRSLHSGALFSGRALGENGAPDGRLVAFQELGSFKADAS